MVDVPSPTSRDPTENVPPLTFRSENPFFPFSSSDEEEMLPEELENKDPSKPATPLQVELEGKTYYKVGENYVYDEDAKYVGELVGGVLRRASSS